MSSGAVRVGLTLESRAVDTEETREGISCRDRGWGSGKQDSCCPFGRG